MSELRIPPLIAMMSFAASGAWASETDQISTSAQIESV